MDASTSHAGDGQQPPEPPSARKLPRSRGVAPTVDAGASLAVRGGQVSSRLRRPVHVQPSDALVPDAQPPEGAQPEPGLQGLLPGGRMVVDSDALMEAVIKV